ncbi:unnamed protein product [Phaedon cochleariae]|uniref:Uncharacterized protein n=1 Tax=Phaedon cochleariae TaxID=80249 RepID=A0A9N9X6A2_PHACE|nr:unnamed protein product [Phaedon cochleariae]
MLTEQNKNMINDSLTDQRSLDSLVLMIKEVREEGSTSYPSSLKPVSKYNILHSYFECNFSDDDSKLIALEFKRQIKSCIKDPIFIDEVRNKIIYLHNYNMKVAEVSITYPFSTELAELLLQYVLLESRTLYRRHYYTGRNEIKAQDRILRLLLHIYRAYFESKSVPAKNILEKSAKAIINMFIEIRRDYGLNNALLENMTK